MSSRQAVVDTVPSPSLQQIQLIVQVQNKMLTWEAKWNVSHTRGLCIPFLFGKQPKDSPWKAAGR